jgi:hypothetical protein
MDSNNTKVKTVTVRRVVPELPNPVPYFYEVEVIKEHGIDVVRVRRYYWDTNAATHLVSSELLLPEETCKELCNCMIDALEDGHYD